MTTCRSIGFEDRFATVHSNRFTRSNFSFLILMKSERSTKLDYSFYLIKCFHSIDRMLMYIRFDRLLNPVSYNIQ